MAISSLGLIEVVPKFMTYSPFNDIIEQESNPKN